MRKNGNTVLITGGGSGLGRSFAQRMHDLGNKVLIAGRNKESLEKTAEGYENITPLLLDVSNVSEIENFAVETIKKFPELNILINNAGIMRLEDLTQKRDLEDAEETINANLLGPIRMINAFINHLKTKKDAVIMNVTSGLAYVPLHSTPTYNATKAALHAYTQSLRETLKGKIEVIEIVPPAVQTELTKGQSEREGYMPLGEFVDEVFSLLAQEPVPEEILVERVKALRFAEASGNFSQIMKGLNDFVEKVSQH